MNIIYHGHSCIQVTDGNNSLIIDPYISENPMAVAKVEDIVVHHVLVTHNHFDHIMDAAEIAKQNNASIIAVEDLAAYFSTQGIMSESMHVGGTLAFNYFSVYLTPAMHSSHIIHVGTENFYCGEPVGIIITMGGFTIYHAGDTGLFGDMKLIGNKFNIDIAFLPIGDRFTMGPDDALLAAEWLNARYVIPIHYGTFPSINQDPKSFVDSLAEKGINGEIVKPGEIITVTSSGLEIESC